MLFESCSFQSNAVAGLNSRIDSATDAPIFRRQESKRDSLTFFFVFHICSVNILSITKYFTYKTNFIICLKYDVQTHLVFQDVFLLDQLNPILFITSPIFDSSTTTIGSVVQDKKCVYTGSEIKSK